MHISTLALAFAPLVAFIAAEPARIHKQLAERAASCTFPSPSKTVHLSSPSTIKAGKSFDCKGVRYDRGKSCTGQAEGGDKDAVFILESGASLSNCIIGADQIEGVHCNGGCTLKNIWWENVCEDAFTIKKQSSGQTTYIYGGGAKSADDKVLQHNGGGKLVVDGFCVQDFGKLYRSCGNCKSGQTKREVSLKNITAKNGKVLVGVNSNYGDVATLDMKTISLSSVKNKCITYKGNSSGKEPTKLTTDVVNSSCKF